jgi:hypothetical protein
MRRFRRLNAPFDRRFRRSWNVASLPQAESGQQADCACHFEQASQRDRRDLHKQDP